MNTYLQGCAVLAGDDGDDGGDDSSDSGSFGGGSGFGSMPSGFSDMPSLSMDTSFASSPSAPAGGGSFSSMPSNLSVMNTGSSPSFMPSLSNAPSQPSYAPSLGTPSLSSAAAPAQAVPGQLSMAPQYQPAQQGPGQLQLQPQFQQQPQMPMAGMAGGGMGGGYAGIITSLLSTGVDAGLAYKTQKDKDDAAQAIIDQHNQQNDALKAQQKKAAQDAYMAAQIAKIKPDPKYAAQLKAANTRMSSLQQTQDALHAVTNAQLAAVHATGVSNNKKSTFFNTVGGKVTIAAIVTVAAGGIGFGAYKLGAR